MAGEDRDEELEAWLREEAWLCRGCGVHTGVIGEYYMVRDEVWEESGCEGMLCIACLEERLGRELTGSDFPEWPVNIGPGWYRSELLRARLTG